jgi:hypothetical protein
MRLPHYSVSNGPITESTCSVLGHPQCGSTQKRDKGAADGQAGKNRRLDRSLMVD